MSAFAQSEAMTVDLFLVIFSVLMCISKSFPLITCLGSLVSDVQRCWTARHTWPTSTSSYIRWRKLAVTCGQYSVSCALFLSLPLPPSPSLSLSLSLSLSISLSLSLCLCLSTYISVCLSFSLAHTNTHAIHVHALTDLPSNVSAFTCF